jgi:hypothetical protein
MKKVLKLDSHLLSNYQNCPKQFYYNGIRRIELARPVEFFQRGTVMTECLEDMYNQKHGGIWQPANMVDIAEKRVDKSEMSDENKALVTRVFYQYCRYYAKEDWVPLATELPFSVVLYEDDEYIFIYEGRIDLLVFKSRYDRQIIVTDNKTYSRESEIYPFNNQAMGYCYVLRTNTFCYNYIGFTQTKKPDDNFFRTQVKFSPQQIHDWKEDTIYWFHKIVRDEDYRKSRQCEGKYGVCSFHELCENPFQVSRDQLITIKYKPNTHVAWSAKEFYAKS